MKQSAVEWYSEEHWKLFIQLENKEITTIEYALEHQIILNQAKEMEKQQIIDAYNKIYMSTGEQYYNKTFKKQIRL